MTDPAIGGRATTIQLTARRFFCDSTTCVRRQPPVRPATPRRHTDRNRHQNRHRRTPVDALDALGKEFTEPEQRAIERYLRQAALRLRAYAADLDRPG